MMRQEGGHPKADFLFLAASWLSTFISSISIQTLPIICSTVISVMAGINYYYQIRNNRRGGRDKV